jgi:hypothetical protein
MVGKSLILLSGALPELSDATVDSGMHLSETDGDLAVKFDTDQLPEILNALETDNGGNKLTLEVSVRAYGINTK